MAAVFAGMTLLQLVELIGGLAGAAKDITDIATELKDKGHKETDPIPVEYVQKVQDSLKSIPSQSTAGDFITNTLGR